MEPIKIKAYGTGKSLLNIFNNLERMDIELPAPQANEVLIDILYYGVYQSDMHQVKMIGAIRYILVYRAMK